MNKKDLALLKSLDPCAPAFAWMKGQPTFREAWSTCTRVDWMLWALRELGFKDDKKMHLFACQCVRTTPLPDGRTVWDLLTDRSRQGIETRERYEKGEATEEETSSASVAAYDAARAAAYVSAARAAASVSAAYVSAAYVSAARAAASVSAAYVSAARAAYDAAYDAAYAAADAYQAKLLRQWVTWDEVELCIAAYCRGNV